MNRPSARKKSGSVERPNRNGHSHFLDNREVRILLDFAEKEAEANSPQALLTIPQRPIVVCKQCRNKLLKVLDGDLIELKRKRNTIMAVLIGNSELSISETMTHDAQVTEMDEKAGYYESELMRWEVEAEEYKIGKKIITGESHVIRDADAVLDRIDQARRILAQRKSPEQERQLSARISRFLMTLSDTGPIVIGDEKFQREHKFPELVIEYPFQNAVQIDTAHMS